MAADTEIARDTARQRMPPAARWTVLGAMGLVFAGALYLIAVRGEALLLDLSALGQRVFCW
jgi:hypothetical protein